MCLGVARYSSSMAHGDGEHMAIGQINLKKLKQEGGDCIEEVLVGDLASTNWHPYGVLGGR